MDLQEFRAKHLPHLELDQARHNLILGILSYKEEEPEKRRCWSLGEGTACAVQTPPRFLVLGDLRPDHCEELSERVRDLDFEGCVGSRESTGHMVAALGKIGIIHRLGMSQRVYLLDQPPLFPKSSGAGRIASAEDFPHFSELFTGFVKEAMPQEIPPSHDEIRKYFQNIPIFFWESGGRIVSMAAINRQTKDGSNISFVYTPPELRGRGYGGSVTAFACEEAFRRGKSLCFLYTDLSNPISNRVYQKIGFRPWCDSEMYFRERK